MHQKSSANSSRGRAHCGHYMCEQQHHFCQYTATNWWTCVHIVFCLSGLYVFMANTLWLVFSVHSALHIKSPLVQESHYFELVLEMHFKTQILELKSFWFLQGRWKAVFTTYESVLPDSKLLISFLSQKELWREEFSPLTTALPYHFILLIAAAVTGCNSSVWTQSTSLDLEPIDLLVFFFFYQWRRCWPGDWK